MEPVLGVTQVRMIEVTITIRWSLAAIPDKGWEICMYAESEIGNKSVSLQSEAD